MPRRRARPAAALLLVALAAVLPACTEDGIVEPGCSLRDDLYSLVLTAQSVSDASKVPCIGPLQPGWELEGYDARNDRARIVLGSDRGGNGAVTIDLIGRCDLAHSTEVPSDEAGAERYEEVIRLPPRYLGTRSYVFLGGCVRFQFDLDTRFASGLVNEASLMVEFVSRTDVRDALLEKTRNHVEQDL